MAPSLQACVRTLDELLDLVSSDFASLLRRATSIENRCEQFVRDCLALRSAGPAPPALRKRLERVLAKAAEVLPRLGARLRGAFAASATVGGSAAAMGPLFEGGRALLDGCSHLAQLASVSPAAVVHLCTAAQLLCICGAECLGRIAAAEGHASEMHVRGALGQVQSFSDALDQARSLRLAEQLNVGPAAVVAAFPPALVFPWAASVGKVLLAGVEHNTVGAVPLPLLTAAMHTQQLRGEVSSLHIAVGASAELHAALQPDAMLGLLELAIYGLRTVWPMLAPAAADNDGGGGAGAADAAPGSSSGGGGPAGTAADGASGSSGGGGGGGVAGGSSDAAGGSSGPVESQLQQAWELASVSLGVAGSLRCWPQCFEAQPGGDRSALLQLAEDFLAALPQQQPATVTADPFRSVHLSAACLPMLVTGLYGGCTMPAGQLQTAAELVAAAQQTGWQPQLAPWVLQQLPAVVRSLQVAAAAAGIGGSQPPLEGSQEGRRLVSVLAVWNKALVVIDATGLHEEAEDAAPWCAAAVAALQLLPTLVAMHQPGAAAGGAALGGPARVAKQLIDRCLTQLHNAVQAAMEASGDEEDSEGAESELAQPLWALHSAVCRAVHWVCTVATASERAALPEQHFRDACFAALGLMYPTLRHWRVAKVDSREERAVVAAHLEALIVLLRDDLPAGLLLGAPASHVRAYQLAVFAAPAGRDLPLCATDGRLAQMLQLCFATLVQAPPGSPGALMLAEACKHMHEAFAEPRFLALLVEEGVLQQLMELPVGTTQVLEDLRISLWHSLRELCEHALESASCSEDTAAASAAVEQLDANRCRSREAVLQQLQSAQPAAEMILRNARQPDAQARLRLQVAQAAAARSCANLRCANLSGCTGGPVAGEGVGAKRCSACRTAWYCGTACSHADWRSSGQMVAHKHMCKVLRQVRDAARQIQP